MITDVGLCSHRGKELLGGMFECSIHGRCSLLPTNQRIRACLTCADMKTENGVTERLFGDWIEVALSKVGITKERVSDWLGEECNCEERRIKLNSLHIWARRVFSGKTEKAKEYLEEIIS